MSLDEYYKLLNIKEVVITGSRSTTFYKLIYEDNTFDIIECYYSDRDLFLFLENRVKELRDKKIDDIL